MKKKVIIGIVVLFAISAAGYTTFWCMASNKFKSRAENDIKRLNILAAKTLPSLVSGDAVTYASIETSGFPFSMNLDFKDVVVKSSAANAKIDHMTLSKALFSNTVTAQNYDSINFSIRGYDFIYEAGAGETITLCLDNSASRNLSVIPMNSEDLTAFAQAFRFFEVNSPEGAKLVEKTTGRIAFKSDALAFKVSSQPIDTDSQKLGLAYSFNNLEFGRLFDVASLRVLEFVAINDESLKDLLKLWGDFSWSEMIGKVNAECDMSYSGPFSTEILNNGPKDGSYNFNIAKWKGSSHLGSFNFQGQLTVKSSHGAFDSVALKFDAESQMSKLYSDTIKKLYTAMAKVDLMGTGDAKAALQRKFLTGFGDLVPDFDKYGKMKMAIDLTADIGKIEAKLNNFSFSHDHYGMGLKGSASRDAVSLDLSLLKYKAMVSDGVSYCEKLLKLMKSAFAEFPFSSLEPGFSEGVNKYLEKLADRKSEDANDLFISFKMNKGEPEKIGKLTAVQAISDLHLLLLRFLKP